MQIKDKGEYAVLSLLTCTSFTKDGKVSTILMGDRGWAVLSLLTLLLDYVL